MNKPFTLHLGDSIQVLQTLPDSSVDAIIVDPPYGTTRCAWDEIIPFELLWPALRRVRKQGAPIVMTACQPFTSALIMSNPKEFRHHWVWEKNKATGHLNAKRAPMRAHEDIVVFCDRQPTYNPQMTDGHKPMNAYTQTSNGECYGATMRPSGGGATVRYPRTVQRFDVINNDNPEKVHPTQKPVDLFAYLVRTYTNPGAVVLDFAMGSGTTGVACLREGRVFVGIDNDPKSFGQSSMRLSRMVD